MLHMFSLYHKLDILLIQEHNCKDESKMNYLSEMYDIIFNPSVCLKGGTCILIRKKLDFVIKNVERSGDSRICAVQGIVHGCKINIVNVYAHSGTSSSQQREVFFRDELPYYLRFNNMNTILGGDFNSVISPRDVSNNSDSLVSKSLHKLIRDLRFCDLWFLCNRNIKYTYVRNDYGSRIDRLYCQELNNRIITCEVFPVSFSDHSSVISKVKINQNIKMGNYYWRLNVKLLDDAEIKEKFITLWRFLKSRKESFRSINNWWSDFVKPEIKRFYTIEGMRKSKERYGLINYLECKLRKQHDTLDANGSLDYGALKDTKDLINNLKSQVMEGAKIRARIQDMVEGEKVSSYLLGKQRSISSKKLMVELLSEKDVIEGLNENVSLKKSETIELYVYKYFEKLYKKDNGNINIQEQFLHFIDRKITDEMNDLLTKEISLKELHDVIFSFNNNRSPGIDGIPIEFYKFFWDVIKDDFLLVLKCILQQEILSLSQNTALISLISKGHDDRFISNWRPVSLLCCDYKILAKILAKRMQTVINELISPEQFCVPGRSINTCNSLIRDIVYYSNEKKSEVAILNLDWCKAFDRVSMDFLYRILDKMGFSDRFISYIKLLYKNAKSRCIINGNIGKSFNIERGVRQGCPLSMLLFAIFQEPFYLAISLNTQIKGLLLPNNNRVKLLGYADDLNIFVIDDDCLIRLDIVINRFETATGFSLNRNKTKIFGMGAWCNRTSWPLPWLNSVTGNFSTLGIIFSNDYTSAIEATWSNVLCKVKNTLSSFRCRMLTLYQKALIVNSLILSKAWFQVHVYPLPIRYSKLINKEIYFYIWGKRCEYIKRETLAKPKGEGGIALVNLLLKSQSISIASFLKMYSEVDYNFMTMYYTYKYMKNLLGEDVMIKDTSTRLIPIYSSLVRYVKNCKDMPNFPLLKSKTIYEQILPKTRPTVESKYPLYNWPLIWENISCKFIPAGDRDILYRYIHEILPNKKRLKDMRITHDSVCEQCNCNEEESNIHMVYFCKKISPLVLWLRRILDNFCNFQRYPIISLLYFDMPDVSKKVKNTATIIISFYIVNIWLSRGSNIPENVIKKKIKAKLMLYHKNVKSVLKEKITTHFTNKFCHVKYQHL